MGVGDQRHAPAALLLRKIRGTHFAWGWMGLRAGLDGCEKSHPHRESIPGPCCIIVSDWRKIPLAPDISELNHSGSVCGLDLYYLKPTGNYTYHLLRHYKSTSFTHTHNIYVFPPNLTRNSEYLHKREQILVLVMENMCVYCEVGTSILLLLTS